MIKTLNKKQVGESLFVSEYYITNGKWVISKRLLANDLLYNKTYVNTKLKSRFEDMPEEKILEVFKQFTNVAQTKRTGWIFETDDVQKVQYKYANLEVYFDKVYIDILKNIDHDKIVVAENSIKRRLLKVYKNGVIVFALLEIIK